MSKKIRDYLFFAFIILFVVGTVFVSLYASGYKINFSWPPKFNRLLIKTGMLALDSSPRGAKIYLNGKVQTNSSLMPWEKEYLTTAAKIKNLLPGEYELKLEREGYWPLNKKVSIYSGQTTFLENINLFRNDLPALIVSVPDGGIELSPSRKYLYASGAQKIITLKTEQEKTLPFPTAEAGIWRKNSDELLSGGRLFNAEKKTETNYQQLIGTEASDWYYDENSNRLYYRNKNSLAYLDLDQNNSVLVAAGENYQTYEPRGEELFLVTGGASTVLKEYSLKTKKNEQEVVLPNVGHYLFQRGDSKFLTIYDDQNKTLYLLNPANIASGEKIIKNVTSWQWLDEESLLYSNNWEIYFFSLKTGASSLLTRVSEEIVKIIWNKNDEYLIFSTTQSLNTFDLKTGIITTIFKTEKIASPVLDDKDGILYFWAQIGQQEGVYRIFLQ
jgi:hypothetical protein